MSDIPIPNWIPAGMVATFALVAILVPTPGGVAGNVALSLGMFLVGLYLFRRCGVGGGAMKFLIAASLWIGPNAVFLAFLGTMAASGIVLTLVLRMVLGNVKTVPYVIALVPAFLVTVQHAPVWFALMNHLHGHA